jgi:hypothetical protein
MAHLTDKQSNNRPILVTGIHRSGTTWIGKMLAASGQAAYISEPLNVLHRLGVMRAPTNYWYTYICKDNEDEFLSAFKETLVFDYHPWLEFKTLQSMKDVLRMGRDWANFLRGRIQKQRPLIKDPFAIFSIPWFIEQLNCDVVVSIRHPVAFASSLKRLNWPFSFQDLLEQPLLMRDCLAEFCSAMMNIDDTDIIEQSGFLWMMLYKTLSTYTTKYPEIHIVRHEDLSRDPISGFEKLFALLGLDFNDKAQKSVHQSSSTANPSEVSRKEVHSYQLNSQENLSNWKKRMTDGEIERIKAITKDLVQEYYPDTS